MIKVNELRIGSEIKQGEIDAIHHTQQMRGVEVISDNGTRRLDYADLLEPKPATEEWLINAGFILLPHKIISNPMVYDLGRNRVLTIGGVGTPNEMVWLCQRNETNPKIIDDLICLHNYDYDGHIAVHTIQNLITDLYKAK